MSLLSEDLRALAAAAKKLRLDLDTSLKLGLPPDDAPFAPDYREAIDRLVVIEWAATSESPDFEQIATRALGLSALLPHIPAAQELVLETKRVLILARSEGEETAE